MRLAYEQNATKLIKSAANIKKRLYLINLPLLRSVDVSDLISADPFLQLGLGQLLSVHTVVQHGQLVHLQVVANAQLPAKVGDVLDGLLSKLLFAKRGVIDHLTLAIYKDVNPIAFNKNESTIDI